MNLQFFILFPQNDIESLHESAKNGDLSTVSKLSGEERCAWSEYRSFPRPCPLVGRNGVLGVHTKIRMPASALMEKK